MTNITDMKAVSLAKAIRRRDISPLEATRAALDRIAARSDLNAFIAVAAARTMEAARGAERRLMSERPLGPLHGVPFSVKDLKSTARVRSIFGSAIFEHNLSSEDAVAVRRAEVAGAILIGKTTSPEFWHKQSTDAPIFGRTLNPIDPNVTCGASSGGAAVAVAPGMGPLVARVIRTEGIGFSA